MLGQLGSRAAHGFAGVRDNKSGGRRRPLIDREHMKRHGRSMVGYRPASRGYAPHRKRGREARLETTSRSPDTIAAEPSTRASPMSWRR